MICDLSSLGKKVILQLGLSFPLLNRKGNVRRIMTGSCFLRSETSLHHNLTILIVIGSLCDISVVSMDIYRGKLSREISVTVTKCLFSRFERVISHGKVPFVTTPIIRLILCQRSGLIDRFYGGLWTVDG